MHTVDIPGEGNCSCEGAEPGCEQHPGHQPGNSQLQADEERLCKTGNLDAIEDTKPGSEPEAGVAQKCKNCLGNYVHIFLTEDVFIKYTQ